MPKTPPPVSREKKSDEDVLRMLNNVCFWLIKQLLDTNATELTNTIQDFHDKEKSYGDFEIIVRRKKSPHEDNDE